MARDAFPIYRRAGFVLGLAKMGFLDVIALISASIELLALAYLYPRYRKDGRYRRWRQFILAKDHSRNTRGVIISFWISGITFLACALISYYVEGRT